MRVFNGFVAHFAHNAAQTKRRLAGRVSPANGPETKARATEKRGQYVVRRIRDGNAYMGIKLKLTSFVEGVSLLLIEAVFQICRRLREGNAYMGLKLKLMSLAEEVSLLCFMLRIYYTTLLSATLRGCIGYEDTL